MTAEATTLGALGIDVVTGDLRQRDTLDAAVAGVDTIVATASAFNRQLGGARDLSLEDVDHRGYLALIDAAETAGVRRFVFVTLCRRLMTITSPLTEAHLAIRDRLATSPMRSTIVGCDLCMDRSFHPRSGFDWERGVTTIFGTGETRSAFVANANIAELVARIALEPDPPEEVEVGGPELLTWNDAADILERKLGHPVERTRLPASALRDSRQALWDQDPCMASVMSFGLSADLADSTVTDEPLRARGIAPVTLAQHLDAVVPERVSGVGIA